MRKQVMTQQMDLMILADRPHGADMSGMQQAVERPLNFMNAFMPPGEGSIFDLGIVIEGDILKC